MANKPTGRKPEHGGCSGGRAPIYNRWCAIKARCFSPACHRYARYGGRGITMCDEWRYSFLAFRAWAEANGFSPELQIDRIDNDKGYFPENCRWVTNERNQANRRRSIIFPDGRTTAQVAKSLGMSSNGLRERLRRGLTLEQAATIPLAPFGSNTRLIPLNLPSQ